MAFYKGTTHNVIIFLFREGIVPVAPTPGALLTPRIRHTAQIHVIILKTFDIIASFAGVQKHQFW